MLVSSMVSSTAPVPEMQMKRASARHRAVRGIQKESASVAAFCAAACAWVSSKNCNLRIALRQSAQANIDTRDLRFETLKAQQEKVRQRIAEKKARREESDVPPPWRMVPHPSEPGQWYYYNEETGETSWELPGSSPWRQVEDSASGRFYYYNQVTGETTWEAPEELRLSEANPSTDLQTSELPEEEDGKQSSVDTVNPEKAKTTSRKGAAARLMAGDSILDVPEEQLTDSEMEIAKQPVDETALKKDAEDSQERLKILAEEAARRREVMKVRREVMKGLREKTSGGLTKDDLMVNKNGKIVSKKQHERGRKLFSQHLSSWIQAVKSARSKLSVLGFRPIGGRSKEGQELYKEAKQIYDSRTD